MNHLERLVAASRAQFEQRRAAVPVEELEPALEARQAREAREARGEFPSFAEALARPGLSLIAEHKRRSPSAGPIREDLALQEVVAAYERGGAAAISVLTEEESFGGSVDDLRRARAATVLPILRKDFIVDRYQLLEAAAAGADAILLIVAALGPRELAALQGEATQLGLSALVEVHDERELETALELDAPVIGINNRDLTTLVVDTRRTFELLPRIPAGRVTVAESGFDSPDQLAELAAAGADAVLIGEALMRSTDIERACRDLVADPKMPRI